MTLKPEELNQRISRFKAGLRQAGVKVTHQRLEIFREVAKSIEHPDAGTIFRDVRKRIPMVSLDTVYRTLWLLLDLGLIATLGPPRERVRFDANTSSHHHFVCVRCGMARDFRSEECDRLGIPDAVGKLGSIETTRVHVTGVCLCCMNKANLEKRALRREVEK